MTKELYIVVVKAKEETAGQRKKTQKKKGKEALYKAESKVEVGGDIEEEIKSNRDKLG